MYGKIWKDQYIELVVFYREQADRMSKVDDRHKLYSQMAVEIEKILNEFGEVEENGKTD